MTCMLHQFTGNNAFDRCRQLAVMDSLTNSRAAATTLAENNAAPQTNEEPV
jgi:hypothetical protein